MLRRVALTGAAVALVALAFAPGICSAQGSSDALKRASDAMGAGSLKTLRYAGDGTGWTFGQAHKPGGAWPKITLHSQVRTINYDAGAMRDEIVLSRAEPLGGGGYPLAGQQRNDQFLSGNYAWNVVGTNPVPGPRFITDRTHQLWVTPHGVLKAAMKNNARVATVKKGGKSMTAASFVEPGRFRATAFINAAGMVERVESRVPDAVLGEVSVVTTYADYRDFAGIKFPSRIRQSMAGYPVLDLMVKEVQPNAAADIAVPDPVRSASERVTTDKVADGVWFIAGGSHNSVLIEMKDHLVLVEAPLGDVRSGPVIDQIKQLVPGKKIRYVVNSHQHFDHSGGLRTAVAEGATIVTQAGNKPYYERVFAVKNTIDPDRMAKSGKKAKVIGFANKHVLTDGSRTIELHRIVTSVHNDTFLMAYLPKEKLLIQADAYTPLPPNAAPPSPPNANNVNLIWNIERLKLDVAQHLPLHGRVVPAADLYATASKPMPK